MTKPESTTSSSQADEMEQTESESVEFEEVAVPKTAKDLFTEFAPDSDSDKNDDEPISKKIKSNTKHPRYTQKYRKDWEEKPELKPWLSESIHGSTFYYCKLCKNDYRGALSDINKHLTSKKHRLNATTPAFKSKNFKFRGFLCPVFAPFSHASPRKPCPELNLRAIPKYASYLSACNVKGILINDIIGEGMSLTLDERLQLLSAWSDACRGTNQFLMVQIGGGPFKEVAEMAKGAAALEVGAIVVLPDSYNRPKSHLHLIRYLKLLVEFTKKTPILYHHNAKFSKVESMCFKFDVSAFLLDITGEIDSFVGVIYTTNDIQQVVTAASVNPEKFTVFMGTEEVILGALVTGIGCIMSASLNFLPKLVESIGVLLSEGKLKEAQKTQALLNSALSAILKEGDQVAAYKSSAKILTNYGSEAVREPLCALWDGTVKEMREKLSKLGLV